MLNVHGFINTIRDMTDDQIEGILNVYVDVYNTIANDVSYLAIVHTCLEELSNRNA